MYDKKTKLNALREMILNGMSYYRLALKSGISHVTLYTWEKSFRRKANKVIDQWRVMSSYPLAAMCFLDHLDPYLVYKIAEERAGIE